MPPLRPVFGRADVFRRAFQYLRPRKCEAALSNNELRHAR